MIMSYASNTSVSSDRSRAEIERTLQKYGATQFMYGWREESAIIAFCMADRNIRFILPMPSRTSDEFCKTPTGKPREISASNKAWEQACRSKWRSLLLVIKAKLEAVEAEISIFEDEFMANIVLPSGGTVSEFMLPQIRDSYDHGSMPAMLPMLPNPNQ